MNNYNPLFPDESKRTEQFRRVIIRKSIQLVRENPGMEESELLEIAEKEAIQVCDLCIESAFDDQCPKLVNQYFINTEKSQRKDHVGRLFVHKLEPYFKKSQIRQTIYPALAKSVVILLGNDLWEEYNQKIYTLLKNANQKGFSYDTFLENPSAQKIMKELISLYWKEMQSTPAFQDQIINQIDDALIRFQAKNPSKCFDIEQFIREIYNDFIQALKENLQ